MSQGGENQGATPRLGLITCGGCLKVLKVDLNLTGKKGVCPKCKAVFVVPAVAPMSPAELTKSQTKASGAAPKLGNSQPAVPKLDVPNKSDTPRPKPQERFSPLESSTQADTTPQQKIDSGSFVPVKEPFVGEIAEDPLAMDPFLDPSPLPADALAGAVDNRNVAHLPGQDFGGAAPYPGSFEPITQPYFPPVSYPSSGYMSPGARVALQVVGGILLAIGVLQLFVLIAGLAWMLVNAEDAFIGNNLTKLESMSDGAIATTAVFLILGTFVTFVIHVLMIIGGVSMLRLRGRPMAFLGAIVALLPCNCLLGIQVSWFLFLGIGDALRFFAAMIALILLLLPGAAFEFEAKGG